MKIKKYFQDVYITQIKLQKKEVYEFEIDEEDIKEAQKRTYKNQLFVSHSYGVMGLYYEKGKLVIIYYHSSTCFQEIDNNHKLKESGGNYAYCVCGRRFVEKDKKTALKKLNKHIEQIKEKFLQTKNKNDKQ